MMRSMYSGVSGLRVHQTKMDVIGNNIANVNTIGFKSQRVNFNEVFSQTIQNSTGASEATGRGGRNAMQVGLGVNVSSIDTLMTQGAAQRTDNPFDLMIDGEGFIIVGDGAGKYFTRAGALRQDDNGNLVIPNGMKVMGWGTDPEGKKIVQGEVGPISLGDPQNKTSPPETTTLAQISGNLDKNAAMPIPVNQKIYDSLGNAYTVKYEFTYKDAETRNVVDAAGNPVLGTDGKPVTETIPARWEIEVPTKTIDGKEMMILTDTNNNQIAVPSFFNVKEVDDNSTTPPTKVKKSQPLEIRFNENGSIIKNEGETEKSFTLDPINLNDAYTYDDKNPANSKPQGINAVIGGQLGADGKLTGSIKVDISDLTQFASKTTVEPKTVNGKTSGTITGFDVAGDGKITAYYNNGATKLLGQICLAQFENPAGLEKVGDNLFKATANSGDFDNIGTAGNFQAGVLEMSNVDLSREFTDMITTQRGFQANSRIISVSDEMLQELVNLKR